MCKLSLAIFWDTALALLLWVALRSSVRTPSVWWSLLGRNSALDGRANWFGERSLQGPTPNAQKWQKCKMGSIQELLRIYQQCSSLNPWVNRYLIKLKSEPRTKQFVDSHFFHYDNSSTKNEIIREKCKVDDDKTIHHRLFFTTKDE